MQSNSNNVLEEDAVIAFYGISPEQPALKDFYHQVTTWFTELKCPPDKLSVHGSGFSGKPVSFSRVNTKLQREGFFNVKGFSVFSLLPDAKIPMNDYSATATYENDPESLYALVCTKSSLANLSDKLMLPIAQNIIHALKPVYGIGYNRERKFGPSLYAIGIGYGGEPLSGEAYEQALHRARWGDLGMIRQVYREGIIRDVYPWNFLTESHLEAKINNIPLQDWIQQDEQRGHLKLLSDGVWLWEVPEANILTVRSTLWNAGIIFNWKNYL
jgi:hypothetical protein